MKDVKGMVEKKDLFDLSRNEQWFWSSTTGGYGTWYVSLPSGYNGISSKTESYHTRCVRGGLQSQTAIRPKSEPTEAQPGTIVDTSTGLIWQKRPDGIERNWQNAKWYCEGLTLGGFSGWELPNVEVLKNMIGKKKLFDHYKMGIESDYWSSTPHRDRTSSAWFVYFKGGGVNYSPKAFENNVRCVRF